MQHDEHRLDADMRAIDRHRLSLLDAHTQH
jgi:hypothetical protein